MSEPIPCPFCGTTHKLQAKQSRLDDIGFCGAAKAWYVYCYECSFRGPIRETQEEAVAVWNIRLYHGGVA